MKPITVYDAHKIFCPLNGMLCRAGTCMAWYSDEPEDKSVCGSRYEEIFGDQCAGLCERCCLRPGVCGMVEDKEL